MVPNDSISLENGLVPIRWQAIHWKNDGLSYWHICASLVLDDLIVNHINDNPDREGFRLRGGKLSQYHKCCSYISYFLNPAGQDLNIARADLGTVSLS